MNAGDGQVLKVRVMADLFSTDCARVLTDFLHSWYMDLYRGTSLCAIGAMCVGALIQIIYSLEPTLII